MATPAGLAPLQPSSGPLEKARSTPVPVIHEEPEKLARARTLSIVSTDSSTPAMSPQSTAFQSPVSDGADYWTPKSSAVSEFSTGFPPGFIPGEPVLGPLPRSMSLVSNSSSVLTLQRSSSITAGRPYPPGLGWTPQVTPHDEGLQRKLSFGFSREEPKLRRTSTDLDAVLEAQIQDHYFSRELLLFYAGAMGESAAADPADVGFLWPKPGFFRMQHMEPEKQAKPAKPEKTKEPKELKELKEPKKPKAKAEPKVPVGAPPAPPPPKGQKPKEGAAGNAGKGTGTHGWKGYGKGQGWAPGWQQGWSKGWSQGWEDWGW